MPDPKSTSDLDLDEFMTALRHPSAEEIAEMRRIGSQPGACGLDADGRIVVRKPDGSLRELKR